MIAPRGAGTPVAALLLFLSTLTGLASSDKDNRGGHSGAVMVSGEVGAGNYSYFRMHNEAPGRLVLKTKYGDADLYVSDVLEQPSFDFGEHNASSTSCGDDEIEISRAMGRPVYIAVYGHPRYETSGFVLQVEPMLDVHDPYEYFTTGRDEFGDDKNQARQKYGSSEDDKLPESESDSPESKFWSFLWDVVYSILHCLVEILL